MKTIKKRLYYDIETSFNQGWFFRAGYKLNIEYRQIKQERAIICICYKWEGEKEVYSIEWKKGCDKSLLEKFVKILTSADEAVGHNGDRFDLAFIRTRCALHQIDVTPFLKTIDTLKVAKSKFMFNSNRLDYIAKFLGIGCKINTGGFTLWEKIVYDNCETSMSKMVRYCKGDVKLLEKVFKRLFPYVPAKTHYGVLNGRKKSSCPECGSERTIISMHRVSAAGHKKTQLKCRDCGRLHTIPTSTLNKNK
jgi:hypothetical protein